MPEAHASVRQEQQGFGAVVRTETDDHVEEGRPGFKADLRLREADSNDHCSVPF